MPNETPLWPFLLDSGPSALPIWPDVYYAFQDCGGLAGREAGYESIGLAWRALSITHPQVEQGYNCPFQVGHMAIVVCKGKDFVGEMRRRGILDDFGRWGGLQ